MSGYIFYSFSLYIVREHTVNLLTVFSVVFLQNFTVQITLIFYSVL